MVALRSLTMNESKEFRELLEKNKGKIAKLLTEKTGNEESLSKEMPDLLYKGSMKSVDIKMVKYIGKDRVDLIKTSFTNETYQMHIDKTGHVLTVHTTRGGTDFEPPDILDGRRNVEGAEMKQILSLIVEIIMFLVSVNGIKADLNDIKMRAAMRAAGEVVETTKFKRALAKLLEEWTPGENWKCAAAIFKFIKDGLPLSAIWKIIKAVVREMSVWEYIQTAAEIAAIIVATFATDGAALIAKIFLALNNAVTLGRKIFKLVEMLRYKTSAEIMNFEQQNDTICFALNTCAY